MSSTAAKILSTSFFIYVSVAQALNSQSFFKDSVVEFKTDFFSRAQHLRSKNPGVELGRTPISFDVDVNVNVPPTIDHLLVPGQNKKNLIVFQSGIHGIEGLAGAAIQNFLLEYLHTKAYKNTSFLYIHMANPAGSYYGRRTNLQNVDLNRNFVVKESEFSQTSEDYAKINSFLNPETPFEAGFLKKMGYYFDSFKMIYTYSIDTLRRSILKGQYSFPKGVYYGGQTYQPEFKSLNTIWKTHINGYENVYYIDLHTGYGEKGRLHLLAGDSESAMGKKLSALFAPTAIDFGNSKNFYQTTGDVLTYFSEIYKKESEIYPITFEFGTMNSQSTLGSMESLYRMMSENQNFHNKSTDKDSEAKIKKLFKEMFYPSEFEWRDKVLEQTKYEVDKILKSIETTP